MDNFIIFTKKMRDGFTGERMIVLPQMITQLIESDTFLSQLYITDIGYYPTASNHYRVRQNPVDQFILIYCVAGKGMYNIKGQTFNVSENQYFILPKNETHYYGADNNDPWTIYWLHFRGKLAKYFYVGHNGPIDIHPAPDSRIQDRIEIFEEIFNTLNSGYSMDNLRYASSLLYHFLGTFKYMREYRNAITKAETTYNVSDSVIHYMKENIEKRLNLNELAKISGLSPSYFTMIFKKDTGHSPISYFNLLKIQHACRLLDTTNMKINQICHKIGMSDSFYFSRLFSKIMGISPSEYKLLNKTRIGPISQVSNNNKNNKL